MIEIQRQIEAERLAARRRYYVERSETAPVLDDYDDGFDYSTDDETE
ncbi:hypothetical protein [Streptomyces sp. NBC_00076]